MYKKRQKRSSSIKSRLFFIYIVTSVPLLLFIFVSGQYASRLMTRQSIQYNHNTISLHLATVDKDLYHTSNYLFSFLLDEDRYSLISSPEFTQTTQLYIQKSFSDYLATFGGYCSLFFYCPEQDILILESSSYDSFEERKSVKAYIRENCLPQDTASQQKPVFSGWNFCPVNGQNYLIEIMEYQDVYVGSFGVCSYVFEGLRELETATDGSLALSGKNGREFPLFPDYDFSASDFTDSHFVSIPVDSSNNDYRISLYIPKTAILGAFSQFLYIIVLLFLLVLLFFCFQLYSVYKEMIVPILSVTAAMESIQQGDYDSQIAVPDTNDEFARLIQTFNHMICRIDNLKIQVYEKKLNQAYARLAYLTLQIKPHFFLNCLNLLYSLGLSGRSELVADFSSALMKHFRYLFQNPDVLVTLAEELEHIKNFLHIQQIRFRNCLTTEYEIQEEAYEWKIPVLSCHTFVENIFKHAYHDTQKMQIRITAYTEICEGAPFLSVRIEDNGKGFPKEALTQFNAPIGPMDGDVKPQTESKGLSSGSHIGIANIRQRLYYLYGAGQWFTCENLPDKGACICMKLPAAANTDNRE